MKTTVELEHFVLEERHQERHAALIQLKHAISKILHPRETRYYGGLGAAIDHFLPLPDAPEVEPTKHLGLQKPDEKQRKMWQAQITEITLKEQALDQLAQQARNLLPNLDAWAKDLSVREDQLLISTLTEADRPDVEAFKRDCARFLSTCKRWADQLIF